MSVQYDQEKGDYKNSPRSVSTGHGAIPEEKSPEKNEYSVRTTAVGFLSNTSAHALPNIISERSIFRKIFWGVAFMAFAGYFVFFFYQILNNFFEYPIAMRTVIISRTSGEFPAVTVCNLNQLRRNYLGGTPYEALLELDTISSPDSGEDGSGADSAEEDLNVTTTEPPMEETTPTGSKRKKRSLAENAIKNERKEKKQSSVNIKKRSGRVKRQEYEYDEDYSNDENYDDYGDEDDYDLEDFNSQDYMYYGGITDEFDFAAFLSKARTDDLSDLKSILKPTAQELKELGHQKEDFIFQCSFDMKNCSEADFTRSTSPTYGNCYTFNKAMDNKGVKTSSRYGSMFGLRLTLNIEPEEYVGVFSPDVGARISIHMHNETSFSEDRGLNVGPGRATAIGVTQRRYVRQKAPYPTNCTEGKNVKLLFGKDYSVSNCEKSCIMRKLQHRCNCTDNHLISESNTTVKCSIVDAKQESCRQGTYYLYNTAQLGCRCNPACTDYRFLPTVSQSEWPSLYYNTFLLKEMEGIDDLDGTSEEEEKEYTKSNLARVHIFLESMDVTSVEEYPSYPVEKLWADIGGLLGLFIGVSVCTILEFFECLLDSCMICGRKCCRKRPKSKISQKR